jgi:hypothetical protein
MSDEQGAAPAVADKTALEGVQEQGSSALTEPKQSATEGTTEPLAEGAAAELPGWMAQLHGDLKTESKLTQFKSVDDLGKSYLELERKLGKSIVMPGEGATAEDVAAFRKAIGTPEKPEDYKLEKVELPNNVELDGEWEKELRELAHKLNLSQAQLGGLHQWYFKNLASEMQVVKTTAEQAHQALRKEMGSEYDAAKTYIKRAVDKFLTPEAELLFARSGLGNHPDILKLFLAIGKGMGEHLFAEGTPPPATETKPFGKRSDKELAELLYGEK